MKPADTDVAQPHSVIEVLEAPLIIIKKKYYTSIPHLGVKAPLSDGLL
jgi:hypothetical protein